MAEINEEEIRSLLEVHLKTAQQLCERCDKLNHIKGIPKLLKRCKAELKFLKNISQQGDLKASHVKSSNLSHLQGILEAAETLPDVVQVLQPFNLPDLGGPLVVDVVCNQGYNWVKVVARNAQALHLRWAGDGQFGERNIVEQAEEYIECRKHHLHNYRQPQIVFIFTAGVTRPLQQTLQDMAVLVHGSEVDVSDDVLKQLTDPNQVVRCSTESCVNGPCSCDEEESDDEIPCASQFFSKELKSRITTDASRHKAAVVRPKNKPLNPPSTSVIEKPATDESAPSCDSPDPSSSNLKSACVSSTAALSDNIVTNLQLTTQPDVKKVNLDITTLLSLVSNACHGGCNFVYGEDVLNEQAAQERENSLVPRLNAFFEGKELYVCKTALTSFKTILGILGGKQEHIRAEELLQKVTIVDDQPSQRALSLQIKSRTKARTKDRTKIIFGTGDTLQAITVTANIGFVRSARNQGVSFAVFVHQPRVLTEEKEKTAKPFVE